MLINNEGLNERIFEQSKSDNEVSFAYSLDEAEKYLDYLDDFSKLPQVRPALDLLFATSEFKAGSTNETYFVALRNTNISDQALEQRIETITDKIIQTTNELNNSLVSDSDKQFLKSAIQYCLKSITKSLNDLSPDDRILTFRVTKALKDLIQQTPDRLDGR